jgi:hypothetical protein
VIPKSATTADELANPDSRWQNTERDHVAAAAALPHESPMKNSDDRLEEGLSAIATHSGNRKAVEVALDALTSSARKSISTAIALGSRDDSSQAEKDRRDAVRGVLLLLFTVGKQPLAIAEGLKAKYSTMGLNDLKLEIQRRSPLIAVPAGGHWTPGTGFTDPKTHNPQSYRYIVFGMMNTYTGRGISYQSILGDPDILKTFMISTSIIDQNHRSTYYPYGFIFNVPTQNFVSGREKDQAFKNYKSVTVGLKHIDNDLTSEVRRVADAFPIPNSPQDVLNGTSGKQGSFGYNEVVVLGTAPGGTQISIAGIFKKVDSKGDSFVRPMKEGGKLDGGAFVKPEIETALSQVSRDRNIPIVPILDTSGENK